jgi:hypothetical protein
MKTAQADRIFRTADQQNTTNPVRWSRIAASAVAATVGLAAFAPVASAAFRAGDVGFSIKTDAGQTWVYGDSWNNGQFIRNAMTLNGQYAGSIRNLSASNWVWPGAPYSTADGRIAMYGAEMTQTKPGIWGFKLVGGVKAVFDPAHASAATVSRMPAGSKLWSAASTTDATGPILYSIDGNHHAHAGRPQPDGSVTEVSQLGGTISGQFSVVPDPDGNWWMVGQLPFLSRRVVAYPLSGPTGKVTGPAIKLITLPSPGPNRFTYAATIHPELSGLMTYAVNGSGPGTPYGLQRSAEFWPYSLTFAKAALATPAAATPLARAATAISRTLAHIAVVTVGADRVKLWPTEKQKELETELNVRNDNWTGDDSLGNKPTDLSPGMNPSAGAPSVWESAGTSPTQPAGEDSDTGSSDFLVPSTARGLKAQQSGAQSAIASANARLKAANAQMAAALSASKAQEAAAKANELLVEAQKNAAEAQGPAAIAAAKQAEAHVRAADGEALGFERAEDDFSSLAQYLLDAGAFAVGEGVVSVTNGAVECQS